MSVASQNSTLPCAIKTLYVCLVITYYLVFNKGKKDQPGTVANPAPRDQVNRENVFSPIPVRA